MSTIPFRLFLRTFFMAQLSRPWWTFWIVGRERQKKCWSIPGIVSVVNCGNRRMLRSMWKKVVECRRLSYWPLRKLFGKGLQACIAQPEHSTRINCWPRPSITFWARDRGIKTSLRLVGKKNSVTKILWFSVSFFPLILIIGGWAQRFVRLWPDNLWQWRRGLGYAWCFGSSDRLVAL